MLFLKIITFPIRLLILLAGFVIMAILNLTGGLICYISEVAGGLLKLVGVLTDFIAVFMTITSIKEIKSGDLAFQTGVFQIAGFWILTILFNTVWFGGYMIGEFIKDLGTAIRDKALELLL